MATEILNLRDFNRDTPVAIETSENTIQISVADALQWIAPGAPPQEVLKFLLTCRTARLNPFLNEAYLIQMGGKWGTIIAKAGYLKRAQEHPDYDGHEAGVVLQAFDAAKKTKFGPLIEQIGEIVPGGYLLVGGWARVWKRGLSRPIHSQVSFSEYDKGTATWKSIPCTMIRKIALVAAIREAFAIGDSYDESEFSSDRKVSARISAPQPSDSFAPMSALAGSLGSPGGLPQLESMYSRAQDAHLAPDLCNRIFELAAQVGMTQARLDKILADRGVSQVADLSPTDASFLIAKLEEVASRSPVLEAFPSIAPHEPPVAFTGSGSIDEEAEVNAGHREAEYSIPEITRMTGKVLPTHESDPARLASV